MGRARAYAIKPFGVAGNICGGFFRKAACQDEPEPVQCAYAMVTCCYGPQFVLTGVIALIVYPVATIVSPFAYITGGAIDLLESKNDHKKKLPSQTLFSQESNEKELSISQSEHKATSASRDFAVG